MHHPAAPPSQGGEALPRTPGHRDACYCRNVTRTCRVRSPIRMWMKYIPLRTRIPCSSRPSHATAWCPDDCGPLASVRTCRPATSYTLMLTLSFVVPTSYVIRMPSLNGLGTERSRLIASVPSGLPPPGWPLFTVPPAPAETPVPAVAPGPPVVPPLVPPRWRSASPV